jgi:hypothetical protein
VKYVSASNFFTCALMNTGRVKCWGMNNSGQLGNNSTSDSLIPVDVQDSSDPSGFLTGISAIAAGSAHVCALNTSGGVKCWGSNALGQLGIGSQTDQVLPTALSSLTSGVSAIAAGSEHTCALISATGGVKCWGNNDKYQTGNATNPFLEDPTDVTNLTSGVAAITAGVDHSCALTTTGGVKCWGDQTFGQLGDTVIADSFTTDPVTVQDGAGGNLAGVTSLSAGDYHTCVIASGAVKCWGGNYMRQLGDGTTESKAGAVTTSGLTTGWTSVEGGVYHSCAVNSSGVVKCWGENGEMQLGDGTTDDRDTPVYAGTPYSLTPADGSSVTQGKTTATLKYKRPVFAPKKLSIKYRIQSSTDISFSPIYSDNTTSATSYVVKNLIPATDYYWRVQTIYKDGSSGSWSPVNTLHTVMVKAPKPGAPGWNSLQVKPLVKFTWSRPSGTPKTGFQYVLQYDTASDFATCDDNSFTTCAEIGDIVKTYSSVAIPVNTPATTIYWRVKVTNADSDPLDGHANGTVEYSGWSIVKYLRR